MEFKELVRFYFKDKLVRITSTTGFEQEVDGKWTELGTDDGAVGNLFDNDALVGEALFTLIDTAALMDGIVPDMGKQVFLAAIRTPSFQGLGFRDAVLN